MSPSSLVPIAFLSLLRYNIKDYDKGGVKYLTDNQQENEKLLSFKERILRDLEEANKQIVQVEKEYDLPVQEISTPENKEDETEGSHSELVSEEPEVQEKVEIPEEVERVEVPEATEVSAIQEVAEENQEETPLPIEEPTREPESSSQPVAVSRKEKPISSVSRKDRDQRVQKKKKQNTIAKRIVLTVLGILFVLMVATGIFAVTYVRSNLNAMDAKATEFVTVEIPAGSSNREIGTILEKKGLIKNGQFFNYYTKFKNYGNFQSGYFNLQKSMDLDTIIQKLQEQGTKTPEPPVLGKITIPEGYTIDQIAEVVSVDASSKSGAKTPYTQEEFLKVIQDDAFIEKMVAKYPKLLATLPSKESGVRYRLEGYLFPATYGYGKDSKMEDLVDQMLAAMDQNLSAYYDTMEAKNIDVNEALTLASLIEKEGATDKDRKDIASVFYNRLNQDMPLQSNIAILYAQGQLGKKTTLKEDATIDTNIESPYNIYKNTGLMPGPVDSPGLSTIEAAVNPSKTDYLYFVANVETGEVYFAKTYEEHTKNVEEHVNSKLTESSSN